MREKTTIQTNAPDGLENIILKQLWINLSRRFSPPSKSFIIFKEMREIIELTGGNEEIIKILEKLEEEFLNKQ